MILFEYLLIATVCSGLFVIGWVTLFMMVNLYLSNRFGYLHMQADKALMQKDYAAATVYNEKLQTVAAIMRKVDNLLYFQFFG
tara:strand:+ start:12257 stop:12505 length:249 start_codon:yes stop_codon:yes gene_type:complete